MRRTPSVFTWAWRNSVSTGLTDVSREFFDSIQIPGMVESQGLGKDGRTFCWYKSIAFGGEWDPIQLRLSDRVELRFETYEPPIVSTTEGQDEKVQERTG